MTAITDTPAVEEGPTVAARLGRLEDIEEIRKLKAAYCAACDDDHNGERVAALFVEDGTWQRTGQPVWWVSNHLFSWLAECQFPNCAGPPRRLQDTS